jgi:hypothetical protein
LLGFPHVDRREISVDGRSQLTLLRRLIDEGPTTAAALTGAEHISQQPVAQSLTPLKAAGYVSTGPTLATGARA